MKTKILGISIPILLLLFSTCEKDKICIENGFCPSTHYMPLAIGNFWIYEEISYNLNNFSIIVLPDPDTVKVVGDTIIKGNQYYTIKGNLWTSFFSNDVSSDTTYWRDSSGYLINHLGEIQFSAIDYDRTLQEYNFGDDRFALFSIADSIVTAATPAGPFNCLDFSGRYFNGLVWENHKYHNYFSKEVGLVYQSYYLPTTQITRERRKLLKEYHLE